MLDFMEWQAKTGVGWVTVGDTPVTHDNTSHWLCEMNVCDDDCIHGMNALVEQCRKYGAELSAELAYAGRGNRANPDGAPTAIVSAERPLVPGDNVRTMDRSDMDYMKERFVDCAPALQARRLPDDSDSLRPQQLPGPVALPRLQRPHR